MCFEGKWLQNRLRADKNESRSLLAVDIQGYQRGGLCIRRSISSSSSLSLKCALRESCCRIGYEPTKMSRDHFWRSISRDTNVEVSAWDKADKRDDTIVQGDWNCQIGSDAYEDWKGTVGKYELKRTGKGEGEKEHRDLLNDTSLWLQTPGFLMRNPDLPLGTHQMRRTTYNWTSSWSQKS